MATAMKGSSRSFAAGSATDRLCGLKRASFLPPDPDGIGRAADPGGGCGAGGPGVGRAEGNPGIDRALRLTLPESLAEMAGAVLMDRLGPFEQESNAAVKAEGGHIATAAEPAAAMGEGAPAETAWVAADASVPSAPADDLVTLVFYPAPNAAATPEDVLEMLPPAVRDSGVVRVETRDVSRDWVEGWRDHFRPITVGRVRIRPPWEPASEEAALVDVVINPGLGFGTGLHPTTRGTLQLLQAGQRQAKEPQQGATAAREGGTAAQQGGTAAREERLSRGSLGPLVDAGTGSGILAIAAAKCGWGPVVAFDNDPIALGSARDNVEANGVREVVQIHEADVVKAPLDWFAEATVLANMTLEPVLALVRKLSGQAAGEVTGGVGAAPAPLAPTAGFTPPRRLVVSGILAGAQECELLRVAGECGFRPAQRLYEAEWVSLELLPASGGSPAGGNPVAGGS